ncbi:hypothetical protein SRABI118_05117 [Massilia sp. Bi118]|uniref:hypothetical protein n=1 Tax=Massilia sp. Bi118 TaxID=2822346 RepID=UPI001E13FE24|nr:hypothetical protein [Massilia sp. Bi118]CAH0318063.1 hypothetical protein SRABI118_05117 [Massilia sp. Bi118]
MDESISAAAQLAWPVNPALEVQGPIYHSPYLLALKQLRRVAAPGSEAGYPRAAVRECGGREDQAIPA